MFDSDILCKSMIFKCTGRNESVLVLGHLNP